MDTTVRRLIEAELPSLRELRHDLHRHPELSFQERRTSGVVQRELAALGVEFKAGYGKGTGVVAHLPGGKGGAVALRADMDALPIQERTGKAYASETAGVMHACGHDGHTTILIGAARVLAKMERPRPVTLLFQPAEEGGAGAEVMVKEGVLKGKAGGGVGEAVERVYGLHGWPQQALGTVASKAGPLMAATDDFKVTMRGVQSHGAYPHHGKDPVLASAQVITALQSIASRNVGPLESVVVSVGAIHGGTADNIIPEEVTFIGTVRTLRAEVRRAARERFLAITSGVAGAMGCEAKIDWHEGYPVTENDPEAAERFFGVASAVLGGRGVERLEQGTMGGEDFAYYGREVPSCFFFLGLRPPGAGKVATLHQPDFDFNDDALPLGIELMVELARRG